MSAVRFRLENLRVHREGLERFGVFRDPSARRAALEYVEQSPRCRHGVVGEQRIHSAVKEAMAASKLPFRWTAHAGCAQWGRDDETAISTGRSPWGRNSRFAWPNYPVELGSIRADGDGAPAQCFCRTNDNVPAFLLDFTVLDEYPVFLPSPLHILPLQSPRLFWTKRPLDDQLPQFVDYGDVIIANPFVQLRQQLSFGKVEKMKSSKLAVLAVMSVLFPVAAHAQQNAKLEFLEVGGNVVGKVSGSINKSFLSSLGGFTTGASVDTSNGTFIGGTAASPEIFVTNSPSIVTYPGPNSSFAVFLAADSASGDYFGFWDTGAVVALSSTYVSGATLNGTSTYLSRSLSTMGLLQGTWIWGYGTAGDTFTLQIGPSGGGAVPEPGEWAAMGILGAGLAGLVLRKRRA